MLKKSFVVLFSFSLICGSLHAMVAQPQPQQQQNQRASAIQWRTNYSQAAAEARNSNKPILLFFTGSDWCGWCKKLESEVFSTPDFAQSVGSKFVFVDIDFPMNKQLPGDLAEQNAQLKKQYGVTGFPTVVILSPNQDFIAETGYRPGGGKAYGDYLLSLLQ